MVKTSRYGCSLVWTDQLDKTARQREDFKDGNQLASPHNPRHGKSLSPSPHHLLLQSAALTASPSGKLLPFPAGTHSHSVSRH